MPKKSRRLTTDGKRKLTPIFAPGGKHIVFATHSEPNRVTLVKLNIADGTTEPFHPEGSAHHFDPAISRDARYHCYAMSASSPQMVLVIKDTKENTESQYRPTGGRSTIRTPRIMPDSSRVIFTLSAEGGQQIASVNMQGQDLKRLTESVGLNCWPDVSPDGKRIVFSSSRARSYNIYVMDASGNNVRQLTNGANRNMRPVWSPDGKRIAFTSVRDGNHEIYVMTADGNGVRRITNHPERDDFPAWHPDGKRLLTIAQRAGKSDLYLLDL